MGFTAQQVKELREMTGAGILDCKNALTETDGDMEKAVEVLRKRNAAVAVKKLSREAKDGLVQTYVHGEGRIGVLVEVNSETDFVARSDDFRNFVKEICLQIAAMAPQYVTREEIPTAEVEKQKEIFLAQMGETKKPPEVLAKIIEGKLGKWYSEVCLMDQAYIREDSKTIRDLQNEIIARCGENIRVRRFARYALGEGL
ncbi:MAG TPA: translation elongation factor Ts [Myxococcota bacterium]|nr:translation elongation factor Ts [Myxococcota bacterium]HQK49991.1 translation elongation factor Ts [Myxococcota bacterium]